MFKIFRKKTPLEKLQKKYEDLTKRSFELSKINRTESDKVYAQAEEVQNKIDALQKK